MLKCDDILKYIDKYWTMDDDDNLKIEIEAHFCDCEHCAQLFDSSQFSAGVSSSWDVPTMTADGVRIADNVMDRIYQENNWAIPVHKKTYQFTKPFKRNMFIAVASSIAVIFVALFIFFSQDGQISSNKVEASEGGVIDVVVATGSTQVSDVLVNKTAVASLSDPIIMKAVPSYSQYYIALAIIAIIGTLLILNWVTRTKQ